jgi:hypothetical protein
VVASNLQTRCRWRVAASTMVFQTATGNFAFAKIVMDLTIDGEQACRKSSVLIIHE